MIKCERCGREFEDKNIIVSVKNGCDISFFCHECNSLFGHCQTCKKNEGCGFFNNPDPTPKFVIIQQKIQRPNGYSVIQRQIPNPARLHKFCLNGQCVCCNEDNPEDPYCCRATDYATCKNYEERDYGRENYEATLNQVD
jgi:hypothetical protein